jgi:hypothetical protein
MAFGLGLAQDHGYFAAHSIDKRNRRLALNNWFRVVDNYAVGDLYVRVPVKRLGGTKYYDLVFLSALDGRDGEGRQFRSSRDLDSCPAEIDRDQDRMFLDICEVVYGPQGVIPSFVWLESFKERDNFRRNVIWQPLPSSDVQPVGGIVAEGEGNKIVAAAMLCSDSESHMIQACSQIIDGIEENAGNVIGEAFTKSDYMKIISGFRITLGNDGVRLVDVARSDYGFEIRDMVICATENAFSAGEHISHDRQPSAVMT